jgi:hypothetical protein
MRNHRAILLSILVAAGGAAAAQTSGNVTEEVTGTAFPTTKEFGGFGHVLLGVGPYEAFGLFNAYGAGFFVEADAARRSWQWFLERQGAAFVQDGRINWSGLKDSTSLYQWIYSSSFGKAIWVKFVHDATRQQIIDVNEPILRRLIDDYDVAITQPPLKTFADASTQDVSAGDEMVIWSRGSNIWVKMGSREVVKVENATAISRVVWQLWFGARPVSTTLRRGLVNHIENLQ